MGRMTVWLCVAGVALLVMLAAHPVAVWLAVRQRAWDPLHDLVFAGLGAALAGLAIWANRDAVAALAGFALL